MRIIHQYGRSSQSQGAQDLTFLLSSNEGNVGFFLYETQLSSY